MKELPLHSSLLLFSSDKMSEGFALGQGMYITARGLIGIITTESQRVG